MEISQDKINNFLNEMKFRIDLFSQTKKQADKYLSSDFNIFNLISPDENKLSDIISDILSIKGTHGQDYLFTEIFIKFLQERGLAVSDDIFETKREYQCDGRIDIFLEGKQLAIIIENKPFTNDQKNQIKRYFDCVSKRYGKNVFIVYLNKNKENPSSYSIPENELQNLIINRKFTTISYYEFIEFLKICYQKCESNKFRYFLNDFIDYISYNFNQDEVNEDDSN